MLAYIVHFPLLLPASCFRADHKRVKKYKVTVSLPCGQAKNKQSNPYFPCRECCPTATDR